MFKFLLIVLCLYDLRTHAFNNGRIVHGMEKIALENYEPVDRIKRATNDNNLEDSDIANDDIPDALTTHSPTNVLEYLTAEQHGHGSSNISVHQLDNTTTSGTINTSALVGPHYVTQSPGILNTTTQRQGNNVTGIILTSTSLVNTKSQASVRSTLRFIESTSLVVNNTQTTRVGSTNGLGTPSVTMDNSPVTLNITNSISNSQTTGLSKSATSAQTTFPVSFQDKLSSLITTDIPINLTSSQVLTTIKESVTKTTELPLGNTTTHAIPITANQLSTISSRISTENTASTRIEQTSKSTVAITTTGLLSSNISNPDLDNSSRPFNGINVTTEGISTTYPSTQTSARVSNSLITSSTLTKQTASLTVPSTDQSSTSTVRTTRDSTITIKSFSTNSTQTISTSTLTTSTPKTVTSVTLSTDIPISEPEPTEGMETTSNTPGTVSTITTSSVNSSSTVKKGETSSQTSTFSKPLTSRTTQIISITTQQQTRSSITSSKSIPTTISRTEAPTSEPEGYTKESDKPTPEPETYTPTPEYGDGYPSSEPEDSTNSVEAEPEFNFDVFAEPGPDWPVAKVVWKQAWEFHIYFFGVAFVLLGLYCFFCVIQLWKMDHLLSRHYFMTLQALVMVICLFRALYLLIDAYNSLGTFPIVLDYFLYSTVFPCITAVFSILFYALLLAIRVRVMSEKIQKLWVLLVITGLHFALSFATDIVVGLFSTAAVMLIICQSFFVFWGLIIFIGYLVIFKRVYKSAISRQEALRRNSTHERKNNITQGFQEKPPKQKYRLGLAVKVTLVSSFFGLACVCFELYGLFGVYGVMRTEKPKPWPWWIYHSVVRFLELAMCASIAYVASQPLKYTYKKKYKDKACLKALPCRYLCCADIGSHRDEVDVNMDQYVVSETDALGWLKKLRLKKFSSPDISAPYPPHTAEKYADPDATLLVRKINKPKPSMLVVEDGFVRIRREDEMPSGNQYDLQSSSSSRSSDINNVNNSPDINNMVHINETLASNLGSPGTSGGVANAGFAQEDYRNNLYNKYNIDKHANKRSSYQGDNRFSFEDELDQDADIADETDIDIAVTDCENSDGYETPIPVSDENSGTSGDIFRPLSDIDLAASMESELERAFHLGLGDESDSNTSHKGATKGTKSRTRPNRETGYNGQCNTDDDWSDSSDGPSRTSEAGLLRRPIRRCKSAETKELQKSKVFDNNRYFSLSSIDSIGKQENHFLGLGSNADSS